MRSCNHYVSSSQESLDDFLKQEQLLLVSAYNYYVYVVCLYVCMCVSVLLCPLSLDYNMYI